MIIGIRQIQQSQAGVGKITKADGTNITVKLGDGSETEVAAAGNRFIGVGDVGIVVGGLIV